MRRSNGDSDWVSIKVFFALLATITACRAEPIFCPAAISSTTQNTTDANTGWKAQRDPLKHVLVGFRLTYGDPEKAEGAIFDKRTLQPGNVGNQVERLTWIVDPKVEMFAICSYFGTDIVLTKSLFSLTTCSLVSERKSGARVFQIKEASCR
jgi:hypothetical protein